MIPAQRSRSSSLFSLGWFAISSAVSGVRGWVRKEIVADDPWDQETLYPSIHLEEARRSPNPVHDLSTYTVEVLPPDRSH
jgi:hypothetical protein